MNQLLKQKNLKHLPVYLMHTLHLESNQFPYLWSSGVHSIYIKWMNGEVMRTSSSVSKMWIIKGWWWDWKSWHGTKIKTLRGMLTGLTFTCFTLSHVILSLLTVLQHQYSERGSRYSIPWYCFHCHFFLIVYIPISFYPFRDAFSTHTNWTRTFDTVTISVFSSISAFCWIIFENLCYNIC